MPSFPTLSGEVHAASELNDNYRGILDEARAAGIARLRDRDGVSLLLIPEEGIKTTLVVQDLARIARDLVAILRPGRTEAVEGLLLSGPWPWLRWLDPDDRAECIRELSEAFLDAAATQNLAGFDEALNAWQVTAEALQDERARAVLLGGPGRPEDYVEVQRPDDRAQDAEAGRRQS